MPGLKGRFIEFYDDTYRNIDDFFGFWYCEVSVTSRYLGLLPYKDITGLTFPTGTWCGWYFSEELKFAQDNGYNIEVIKGYKFDKKYDNFKEYVDTLSNLKANSEDVTLKNLAKLLSNSLFGKLGMNPIQPVTKIIKKEKLEDFLLSRKILQEVDITENDTLISYLPGPDKDILNKFEVDINKALNTQQYGGIDKHTFIKNLSIPVAAAVTAYTRIYISTTKLNILNSGGKIYYSDTDSIITDKVLDNDIVDPKQIGKFKLEFEIDKAYMPAPKVYAFIKKDPYNILSENEKIVKKAKGGNSEDLNLEQYLNMVKGVSMRVHKKSAVTNWSKGSVIISKEPIDLSSEAYISREKIYKNGLWVDTKPININETDISDLSKKVKNEHMLATRQKKGLEDISNKDLITNKSDSKSILIWIFLIFIFPVSLVAYLLTLEEDGFNLDDFIDFLIDLFNINNDKQNKDDSFIESSQGDSEKEVKVKAKTEVEIEIEAEQDSYNPFLENELKDVKEKLDSIPTDIELNSVDLSKPEIEKETLYQGFKEELSKIENKNNKTEDAKNLSIETTQSNCETSDKAVQTTPGLWSPPKSDVSNSPVSSTPTLWTRPNSETPEASPDCSKDMFTPTTLSFLDKEIKENDLNLENLDNICKDETTKQSVKEKLIEEAKYLLDQKSNHLNSILQQAKNTPINSNETDVDNLHNEISCLKTKVKDLYEKSKDLQNRLDVDENNPNSKESN